MVNMITEQEAEKIELEFMDAMPEWRNYSKEKAEGLYKAWNHLWALMERENNFSNKLGSSILDWQIGNWAGDLTMVLHNAGLYNEVIKINEQILQIKWSSNRDDFYENAKRDIADAYADLGDIDKCYQLYEKYLKEDQLWGWGWIGYYRQLSAHDDSRFEETLDELYRRIEGGDTFRDREDIYRELGDEYNTLGVKDRADYFYALLDKEKEVHKASYISLRKEYPDVKGKIYPNEPCPCGSGKKYKKCCGNKIS